MRIFPDACLFLRFAGFVPQRPRFITVVLLDLWQWQGAQNKAPLFEVGGGFVNRLGCSRGGWFGAFE
jgi:hypothetical protein